MDKKIKFLLYLTTILFMLYTLWWVSLRAGIEPFGLSGDIFSDTYGVVALLGGIAGLLVARAWGGFKSYMGRAISAFSLGLLAQALGQIIYSYYFFFLGEDIPYPSLGDIGYFGSVLLYIYGIYSLAKVSGARISLKLFANKLQAVLIPAAILFISYSVFLRDYEFDPSAPLTAFLDFGYPLGQAIYIAIAILTYTLSRKILGGIMKNKILFLLLALAVQYVADYMFLYQNLHETWTAGGVNDFTYLIAYVVMTMALIRLNAGVATNEQ